MSKSAHVAKAAPASTASPKKSLKELFDERDHTLPGSKQEEQAAEKILEAMFPDTNAD